MKEEAVLFGERESLVGVLTDPANDHQEARAVGVILLNPGVLHRVGPGRIYVKIARELAAIGFTVLRFDFSGIGDSKVRHDNLPFDKSSLSEARCAMDLLGTKRGIDHFLFIGGCSGARVSFTAACGDPRVVGGILINFPADADDDGSLNLDLSRRKDEHYYWNFAIRDPLSWRKLFTGKSEYRKIIQALMFRVKRRFGHKREPSPDWLLLRERLELVVRQGVRPVFVCSQGDPRLGDLREAGGSKLRELCSQGKTELVIIGRSDHTFSSLIDQERLIKVVCEKAGEILRKSGRDRRALSATDPQPSLESHSSRS
jgi:pimeloyl-ACP methyl ester carboxylesterase